MLEALVAEDVEFLLIGGVAVGFHGYIRATKDVDIVPAPARENLERLAHVLETLNAEVEGADELAADELPDPCDVDALASGGNWVLNTRLGRFDIMQWIGDEALWEKLAPRAIGTDIGHLPVKVAGYADLVALKEHAGRPEDLLDLQRLQEARKER